MSHRIVCAIGPNEWSSSIGKIGSVTSFSTYDVKKDESIVSILEPSKYPEKIWSLLFSLYLSDEVFLMIDGLDRHTAEILLSLDIMNKQKGFISVTDKVDIGLLSRVIKGNVVEGYRPFDPEPAKVRDGLFDLPERKAEGPSIVVVDQAFNVKGVGCVVLGFVASGTISKHQELSVLPTGIRTNVRSIQIHDRDVKDAPSGSRVGLALKNIDPESLKRGSVLTDDLSVFVTEERMEARIKTSSLWKEPIDVGMRLHAHHGLQFSPCMITESTRIIDGEYDVTLEFESPFTCIRGGSLGLVHLDSKTFRLFSSGETI